MTVWRSRVAAVVILFVLGTFAGQIRHVLDTVRGRIDDGRRVTEEIRATVTTIANADTTGLVDQIAQLEGRIANDTATPDQIAELRTLVARQKAAPGPPGPTGPVGPPGPTAASTTTTAGLPVTTTTTATTTTTRPPTTTTTRCVAGVGKLVKVGC